MDAAELFARAFVRAKFEDLEPALVRITKHQVLDLLGVAVAGIGEPGPRQLLELVQEWGGREESAIIGSGMKVPAPNAAQVNAALAHARDYDDVHEKAVMHPGIVSIVPALALAERTRGVSGRELITAVALGTDMVCRLGLATRPGVSPIQTGWHFTTLYGYPTAALTSGRILGLDEEQMISAFGLAYHQCGGNGQCVTDGTLAKRLGPGFAVRGGMTAALMARKGITGARNSLEGDQGLFKVYHGGAYDRDLLVGGLGRRFEGLNVSLKPYPCCRGVHAAIDAALALRREHGPDLGAVREIVIRTGANNHRLLCTPFAAKVQPRNAVDSQFSIPWGVATALLHGRVGMEHFTSAAVRGEAMLSLTSRVRTEVDPAMDSARGVEPASVSLLLGDGRTLSARTELAIGSPEQPLGFDDCVRKFRDCVSFAGDVLSPAKADRAIELVADLERLRDVSELVKLFN